MSMINSQREWILAEKEKVVARLEMLENAEATLEEFEGTGAKTPETPCGQTHAEPPSQTSPGLARLLALDINMDGTKNLIERVRRIAQLAGGPLNVWDLADYLIDRGCYSGKRVNLRSHVHTAMSEDPEFIKAGKNLWDFVPAVQDLMTPAGSDPASSLLQ